MAEEPWLSKDAKPYDPRPAIEAWKAGDLRDAPQELWRELCPQGIVSSASYAAVGEIVRMMQQQAEPDGNAYALVASIEEGRHAEGSPPLPFELEQDYQLAWAALLPLALRDLAGCREESTVRSILVVIAHVKGQRSLAATLSRAGYEKSPTKVSVQTIEQSDTWQLAQDDSKEQLERHLHPVIDMVRQQGRGLAAASEQIRGEAHGLERLVETATASADQTERHILALIRQTAALAQAGEEIEHEASGALAEVKRASLDGEQLGASATALMSALDEIAAVVTEIDQLSKKINLLSLNARIEASRSGALGAGFAVVADEVKALATLSAELTRDAAGRIGKLKNQATLTFSVIQKIALAFSRTASASGVITDAVHRQVKDISLFRDGTEAVAEESQRTAAAVAHARSAITVSHDAAELMDDTAESLAEALASLSEIEKLLRDF